MNQPRSMAISVAIITLNEEERLPKCLESLSFADEVVVVDANSTDRTVKIAKNHGAKVYVEAWQGFGRQKQKAINLCSNSWVLILDADERISEESAAEIKAIINVPTPQNSYSLPRKNIFLGRWIKHAGWWPDRVVRLINKEHCSMSKSLVHESIQVEGVVGSLNNPIIHFATRNLQHTMEKMNNYSSAGAQDMLCSGAKSNFCKAVSRAVWAFFYNYIIRLGFLDMGPGFIIAVSDAANKFFKYAKLAELQNGSINNNS
jgi:glycosyltransferase involved in cell wall biosynthesis